MAAGKPPKPVFCPHCAQPIDPRLIRKAANTLAASAKRPGSAKNARNPYGRKGKPKGSCPACHCLKSAHHGPHVGCEGAGGNCGCMLAY